MGVCNCSMFCCALFYVHSSIASILMGKRELIALLNLSSWCLVMVEWLILAVPGGCLQFVIVVFPDHTHLLFWIYIKTGCAHTRLYDSLIETMSDFNFNQMVRDPTRQGNNLDLFLTTNHTLVNSVNVIPGLSDHNIVKCLVDTKPASTKKGASLLESRLSLSWSIYDRIL